MMVNGYKIKNMEKVHICLGIYFYFYIIEMVINI